MVARVVGGSGFLEAGVWVAVDGGREEMEMERGGKDRGEKNLGENMSSVSFFNAPSSFFDFFFF